MLKVVEVSKSFSGRRVLHKVSFEVGNGEVVGYVGLNGAGKTTTIRIIVGVLHPDEGDVVIDGYSVLRDKRRASERVGWIPETPIFETDFRALDYFVYLAGYYGISKTDAVKLGKELLEMVGLGDAMRKKLSQYSLGMKKRFALAVSMINDPQNFVFDEVLNGLDPQGIAFFRNLVSEFKKRGKAVLFSSHILKEVEQIADKVVFIHKGRIIGIYTMEEIVRASKPSVRLMLAKRDENALNILREYGEVIARNGEIVVKLDKSVASEEIVEKLVKSGIRVREIRVEERDLETFFFELISRAEKL